MDSFDPDVPPRGRMKRLVAADVVLGEPLPYSVFDQKGHLLLRAGVVVSMPDQVDRLIVRGALIPAPIDEGAAEATFPLELPTTPARVATAPVFDRMASLILNLKHVATTALKSPEQIDLPVRLGRLATTLIGLCQEDPDGALAAPYLDTHSPNLIVHLVLGAVLAELVARRLGWSTGDRLALAGAALTRDWGQIALQSELDKAGPTLAAELQSRLRDHPELGATLLQQAGIRHPAWLEAVRQHHERLDGSGYPQGLAGAAIGMNARILAIVDCYSAMVRRRPHRAKPMHPQGALRELLDKARGPLDRDLLQLLIHEIGLFPPGSIVRLKCGEIAVVKRPALLPEAAEVFSVYNAEGGVLSAPLRRDTGNPEHKISGVLSLDECRSAAITIKRIWLDDPPSNGPGLQESP